MACGISLDPAGLIVERLEIISDKTIVLTYTTVETAAYLQMVIVTDIFTYRR